MRRATPSCVPPPSAPSRPALPQPRPFSTSPAVAVPTTAAAVVATDGASALALALFPSLFVVARLAAPPSRRPTRTAVGRSGGFGGHSDRRRGARLPHSWDGGGDRNVQLPACGGRRRSRNHGCPKQKDRQQHNGSTALATRAASAHPPNPKAISAPPTSAPTTPMPSMTNTTRRSTDAARAPHWPLPRKASPRVATPTLQAHSRGHRGPQPSHALPPLGPPPPTSQNVRLRR